MTILDWIPRRFAIPAGSGWSEPGPNANGPLDALAIHALHEPAASLALLLGPFPLRDVDHHATEPGGVVPFPHHGHLVSQPHHPAVGRDHAVLEVVPALLGRFFTELHHRLAIVRVQVLLPESRVGDPALRRMSE